MKILVTGSSGFIAGHLIQALLERGNEVTAIDKRVPSDWIVHQFLKYEDQLDICQGYLTEIVCKEGMRNIQVVYHLASETNLEKSMGNPVQALEDDLTSTVQLLEACKEVSPDARFIFTSSAAVYGHTSKHKVSEEEAETAEMISTYGINKRACEFYIDLYKRIHKLSIGCVRFFNVYGPGQLNLQAVIPSFILSALKDKELLIKGDGSHTRDFVHVSDVVEALLLMGKSNCQGILNVGTGESHSIKDLVVYLEIELKKKLQVENISMTEWDIKHSCADVSSIEELIGWKAKKKLDEGLKDTIEYYKQMI
ncbi:MAG: NAD-dependent epimerase/dehydratase family protein [Candidatus Heimdallarchaeaceae archaeon]